MIWKWSLPGLRDILLQGKGDRACHHRGIVSTADSVVAMSVCSEFRKQALLRYKLVFGTPYNEPRTYIDFNTGIIRLRRHSRSSLNISPENPTAWINVEEVRQIQDIDIAKCFLYDEESILTMKHSRG